MDREKTGGLIASARKERGLTQKELAAQLHVSDRAVSKWERGAGFPDVSLLEPLADALGVERMLYITENMQSFGLKLEDGRIIATDPEYVPLLESGYYYSIRPVFGMHS